MDAPPLTLAVGRAQNRLVDQGDTGVRTLSCADLFHVMAFAQITWRESLRDIDACLAGQRLVDAPVATLECVGKPSGLERDASVYALDSTTIDRGYLDFARLYAMHQAGVFFVTRAKHGMDARRVHSSPTQRATGVIGDQHVMLNGLLFDF